MLDSGRGHRYRWAWARRVTFLAAAGRGVVVIAPIMAALIGAVWVKTRLITSGYRIAQLKQDVRALELELAEKETVLARMKSRREVSRRAKAGGFLMPGEYPPETVRYLQNFPEGSSNAKL